MSDSSGPQGSDAPLAPDFGSEKLGVAGVVIGAVAIVLGAKITKLDLSGMGAIRWVVLLLPLAAFAVFALHRWSRVQSYLGKWEGRGAAPDPIAQDEARWKQVAKAWPTALLGALSEARAGLDGEAQAKPALKALRDLEGWEDSLAKQSTSLVSDALETGEVRSQVVERRGLAVYLLVVPSRHDNPQALQRHAAFADGWRRHEDRLVGAGGERAQRLLSLLAFLDPLGKSGALSLAFRAGDERLLPGALLEERELRESSLPAHASRYAFQLCE